MKSHHYLATRGAEAARRVVDEVLEIAPKESVLITNDTRETLAVSELLAGAVALAGATPTEVLAPPTAYPGADIPAIVANAARSADVWIELNESYILGSPPDHKARREGTRRFYSLSGMSVEELVAFELDVDRALVIALGTRLAEITTNARTLRVTCPNGSDFTASCSGRTAEPDTTTMTVGQTHVTPASVEGRLVFDGAAYPPASLGLLSENVAVEFPGGRAEIVGSGQVARIAAAWQASLGKAEIYELNHFSYGYHPNVPFAVGRLVADERVFGCLCVGFGPAQPYSCHMDMTLLSPTVEVDGTVIERDGVYLDPELRSLSAQLGVPGY